MDAPTSINSLKFWELKELRELKELKTLVFVAETGQTEYCPLSSYIYLTC